MNSFDHTRRTELAASWLVAVGVAAAGTYDFLQGSSPGGVFGVDSDLGLWVFLLGCVAAAALATALTQVISTKSRLLVRTALLAASFVPVVFADPTYASLLVAIPLIDVRRRDPEPQRTAWTLAVVGAVTWFVITEDTPRVVSEVEAMLGLAIAFVVVVFFGDTLRQLDRALTTETEMAQLTERSRIAEELHDSLGHHLLASSVQLQKAKALQQTDPASSVAAIDYASQAIAEAISETRLIVNATRADQQFRVEPSIRELTRRVVPGGTAVTIEISGDHDRLDTTTQVAIYRVVQEALTNLVRHSSATTARIASDVTPDSVRLEISDNGSGFDATNTASPGGLGNMRRRVEELGGTFNIVSAFDGTAVIATVPR
ncbi:MAG: sensor histidine kinase [Acidimicrobiales bacterium]